MPTNLFPLDNTKKFTDQKHVGHNRWHPDIPPNVSVKPGDVFRADCREWFDGAIKNDDSADDVRYAPLPGVHVLSGPFRIEGAAAGRPAGRGHPRDRRLRPGGRRSPLRHGLGLHRRLRQDERRRLPDRAVPGRLQGDLGLHGRRRHLAPHPRVLVRGHPPSGPHGHRSVGRAAGEVDQARDRPDRDRPGPRAAAGAAAASGQRDPRQRRPGDDFDRIAGEAARTAPPRENGGNQDIKNFTAGTRVFYPVFVDGANLSFGDLHFSQGDGEITFCGAIEMGGFMDLHVDVIKGGMEKYGIYENAIFMPGLRDPQYSEWIAFSGVSVDLNGKQHYLNSQLSYERACHHAIDYLMQFGYSDIQAYMILGSAPIEGRFSGVVDIPNSCATVYVPTAHLRLRRRARERDAAPGHPGHHGAEDPELGAAEVAIYEYRCERDGSFEVTLPIGTAPASIACPECADEAGRVFSDPDGRLVRAAGAVRGARARGEDEDRPRRRDVDPAAAEARADADGAADTRRCRSCRGPRRSAGSSPGAASRC